MIDLAVAWSLWLIAVGVRAQPTSVHEAEASEARKLVACERDPLQTYITAVAVCKSESSEQAARSE